MDKRITNLPLGGSKIFEYVGNFYTKVGSYVNIPMKQCKSLNRYIPQTYDEGDIGAIVFDGKLCVAKIINTGGTSYSDYMAVVIIENNVERPPHPEEDK
jgi:hypothetical protein